MDSQEYLFRHLAGIFHTGVFCLCGEQLVSYEDNPEYNPLYTNEPFRSSLVAACEAQAAPLIVRDDFHMFYICVKGTDEAEKVFSGIQKTEQRESSISDLVSQEGEEDYENASIYRYNKSGHPAV